MIHDPTFAHVIYYMTSRKRTSRMESVFLNHHILCIWKPIQGKIPTSSFPSTLFKACGSTSHMPRNSPNMGTISVVGGFHCASSPSLCMQTRVRRRRCLETLQGQVIVEPTAFTKKAVCLHLRWMQSIANPFKTQWPLVPHTAPSAFEL